MPILTVHSLDKIQTPTGEVIQISPSASLQRIGPIINTVVAVLNPAGVQPDPNSVRNGAALIDTGASTTCIDVAIAGQLNLPVIDVVEMTTPSHQSVRTPVYACSLFIPGLNYLRSPFRIVGSDGIGCQGLSFLLGRDVLEDFILHYDGKSGIYTLAV